MGRKESFRDIYLFWREKRVFETFISFGELSRRLSLFARVTVQSLIDNVLETKTNFCVITGGEPCMYDLNELTNLLKENGIEVALETSGCYELKGQIDWYCFSPKKFKAPVENAYLSANELKVIISHPSDFEWAEQHAAKVSKECKLYLQPEWSKQERFLSKIIDYVKENPNWNISLQTHKFMNIP